MFIKGDESARLVGMGKCKLNGLSHHIKSPTMVCYLFMGVGIVMYVLIGLSHHISSPAMAAPQAITRKDVLKRLPRGVNKR